MRSPIPSSWHRLRAATFLHTVVLAAAAACSGGESGGTPTPPPAESLVVSITPRVDTLLPGATRTFSADVRTTAGAPRTIPIDWSTLDPAIATVSNGTVTAVAPGSTRLVARARNAADTAIIVVRPTASSLTVEPNAVLATVGDTITFSALLAPSSPATTIIWGLTDSTLAEFIAPGSIRLLGEGGVRVLAAAGASTASAAITIRRSPVASVSITPNNLTLAVGDTGTFVAVGRDQLGRPLSGVSVTWSTTAPGIATVAAGGVVSARAIGGSTVTATIDGRAASAAVNVSPAPARSVTLTLPNDSLSRGRTMQALATPLDANGQAIAGRPLAWQSSNPSVATVTAAGLITAIAAGRTTISVIVDSRIASVQLTVVIPVPTSLAVTPAAPVMGAGSTVVLAAEVRDQMGVAMPGQAIAWQSSDGSVAVVDATGRLSAVTPGTADVVATSGAITGASRVTVVSTTVASVSLTPAIAAVTAGESVSLAAVARDASGNVLPGRPIIWLSTAGGIAAVSPSGIVTGLASGVATILATVEGTSASASVTVSPAPASGVAKVSLSIAPPTIGIGEFATAAASALDAAGKALSSVAFTYSSSDTAVAAIAPDGIVLGRAAGSTTIAAQAMGVTGYTGVTVRPSVAVPVASVHLSAQQPSIAAGDSTTIAVTLRDATGRALTGRLIAFTSSNAAVATVSAAGVVRGIAAGSVIISAASEGVIGTVPLTIGASARPSVASVTVTINSAQLTPPQGTQAIAVLRDSAGNALVGRSIAWSSSNTAVATVAPGGYVTSVAAGSATITAQSEGKSGSATVSVTLPPPASNLTIVAMHLQQVVQDLAGTVPIVAGREALLRVFVRASTAGSAPAAVRVRLYNGTALLRTDTIAPPGSSVSTSIAEGVLASSWNLLLPAPLVQPGLRVLADVDPANVVAEGNEGDNSFPASGSPQLADVRVVAPFAGRLVPILQRATNLQGDVSTTNAAQFLAYARALYPLQQLDVDVRAVFTTNAPALQPNDANGGWSQVLGELNALRTADGSARYYYGVVRTPYNSGLAGMGLVGGRAAMGWDFLPSGDEILAHEVGHNFGRLHAPSCGAASSDPAFPFAGGVIGAYGYNVAANALLPPTTPDVMGNCEGPWISPYTYAGVLAYRATNPLVLAPRVAATTSRSGLLVWGRMHRGTMTLEPAYEVEAPPALPKRPGRHLLEGFGARGEQLFAFSFDADQIADSPDSTARHFAFVIPLESLDRATLTRMRWTHDGQRAENATPLMNAPDGAAVTVDRVSATTVRVRWSPDAVKGVLIRDAASGQILTFGRDGEALVQSTSGLIDLVLSDGLRSERRRVAITPASTPPRR